MELFSVVLMTWTSKVGRKTSTNWQFLVAKAKLLVAKATHTGAISSPDDDSYDPAVITAL